MSHGDIASMVAIVSNRRKIETISNLSDDNQISVLAPKNDRARASFLTPHFPGMSNVKLIKVLECNADLRHSYAD